VGIPRLLIIWASSTSTSSGFHRPQRLGS
jgi:hypothetical protein